ncbi:Complex 1 LYR protein [Raphanus sativus]|nr:Complex 1 LYR protein [Raphanus sativus]
MGLRTWSLKFRKNQRHSPPSRFALGTFWIKDKMSSEVGRVYRDLLKAVVKHVGKEDHKSHFTDFVKHEFRKNPNSLDKINLARNYAYLLNSIHSHKDLLFSYNIAVDRTEEMKRVLGKSAASVGLRLPEVYQP